MQNQPADVTWNANGIPVSNRFDDPYFSLENGLEETRYVFLRGNDLPYRFCNGFHIAELGFGTGLNFLTTLLAWRAHGTSGCFEFTSFEAYPMSRTELEKALSVFPELDEIKQSILKMWHPEGGSFKVGDDVVLHVIVGNAFDALSKWPGKADAWYLDGFSPAKNPDMWSDALIEQVASHTARQGTVATYTAAGAVRRSLTDVGFDVKRIDGYGRKRHMTIGVLNP